MSRSRSSLTKSARKCSSRFANSEPDTRDIASRCEDLLLRQSMLRIVLDQCRAIPYMARDGLPDCISVVAFCALSRAAVMLVRLYGSSLSDEDTDELRFNLRRFGNVGVSVPCIQRRCGDS